LDASDRNHSRKNPLKLLSIVVAYTTCVDKWGKKVMERPPLGDGELEVLRFVTERAPIPAREVAERFGEERGLARTTVLTVIERLRRKGYLMRRRRQGVYVYSPRVAQAEVLQGLVRQFVEKTLGGSLSPVVAYLARTRGLSDAELAELQALVKELRAARPAPEERPAAPEESDA
jgi:predicted transcriptional regulator